MSNNTVTFTINFGGNAVVNGEKITKVVGEMQRAFAKFSGILDDITQMFLKFNQLTEGIQSAVSELDALTGVMGRAETHRTQREESCQDFRGIRGPCCRVVQAYTLIVGTGDCIDIGGSGRDG